MTVFIIQCLLLLAVAFILGCLIGSFLRYLFTPVPVATTPAPKPAPVAAPVMPQPTPAPVTPTPAPVAAAQPIRTGKDNLQEIWGVGPKLEGMLNDIGIYRFEQIAAWSQKEVDEFNDKLSFQGRIERDEWLKQARDLASKSNA